MGLICCLCTVISGMPRLWLSTWDGIWSSPGLRSRKEISIARAFLKDAPVILPDETGDGPDIENGTAIREALSRLIRHETVMAIAHRVAQPRTANAERSI